MTVIFQSWTILTALSYDSGYEEFDDLSQRLMRRVWSVL